MSDLLRQSTDCECNRGVKPPIRLLLAPVDNDLGGFSVRRLLPASEHKSVGPFVFFDHLGPARFAPGMGIDVRPHPHIGLATVTYLFEGEILHRDSLGNVVPIRPQEINWMTAGRGIVHSERTPPTTRAAGHDLHALQLWVALPVEEEECEPAFFHYDNEDLPEARGDGWKARIMVGEAFGVDSPVRTWSPTLFVEINLTAGTSITLPDRVGERAVYLASGAAECCGNALPQHVMAVLDDATGIELTAEQNSRLVMIGGEPLGRRSVWWNLVASRRELIETAKERWRQRLFPAVPGETEFIPLP